MSAPAGSTAYTNMVPTMALSSPQAIEAGRVVQQTAKDIQDDMNSNEEWSLRVLSLIAGVVMITATLLGFFGKLVTIRWDSAILDALVFCVGLGVVLIESGIIRLDACSSTNNMMNKNAPFLRSLKGRGVVFVIA